jgi:hypothetical protein
MNGTTARFLRLGVALSGLAVLGWVLTGQASEPAQEGTPIDWSHRHVIFSEPSTFEEVAQVTSDPRYWQQWYRNNVARALPTNSAMPNDAVALDPAADRLSTKASSAGAWSEDLGQSALGVAGTVGAGNYPAKYSPHITTASCSDYVVFNTGLAGSATQASIVAYSNLYAAGCTAPVPQTYWAYNTGGTVLTSPALSQDGTQVAFVETNGGFGILVLLKWAASTTETVGSPKILTAVSNAAYRGCIAPCMTEIILRGGGTQVNDTTSSAFPDYNHDVLWVGGALGWLHKISGAFLGTPGEVSTGGFPVQMNVGHPNGNTLSSPVYDRTSGNVYVGDYGGIFYQITTASPPVVTASGQIDHGTGIVAGPVIDSTKEKIYVFSSSDGSTACAAGTLPCSAVFQFAPGFAPGSTGVEAIVGTSQAAPPNPSAMYEGAFDSTYEASGTATGNFYVCGNTGGTPTLYQIPIAAGVMKAPIAGPSLAGASTGCSPVTDISNPNAAAGISEWIFASAQASGSGNNCAVGTGGCVMNFNVQPWLPSHAYTVGQIVLDSNLNVQVCRVLGTSRTAAQGHPAWNLATNGNTADNTVRWTNQGAHRASHPAWLPSHAYTAGTEILDSNGNVQWVITAGTSRTAALGHPVWKTVITGATTDGSVIWRMVGLPATFSVAAAGGTSGIIIDNNVGSGTLAGASQVYFSTLNNQACTTGGTGGCAVQASQSDLQ